MIVSTASDRTISVHAPPASNSAAATPWPAISTVIGVIRQLADSKPASLVVGTSVVDGGVMTVMSVLRVRLPRRSGSHVQLSSSGTPPSSVLRLLFGRLASAEGLTRNQPVG